MEVLEIEILKFCDARAVVQVSAFLVVKAVLAIVAWIGYTLVTTLVPLPLEDFVEENLEEQA